MCQNCVGTVLDDFVLLILSSESGEIKPIKIRHNVYSLLIGCFNNPGRVVLFACGGVEIS